MTLENKILFVGFWSVCEVDNGIQVVFTLSSILFRQFLRVHGGLYKLKTEMEQIKNKMLIMSVTGPIHPRGDTNPKEVGFTNLLFGKFFVENLDPPLNLVYFNRLII